MRITAHALITACLIAITWPVEAQQSQRLTEVGFVPTPGTFDRCTNGTVTGFSHAVSWIDQRDRIYLLADRAHGRMSTDNEGGVLQNATSGDVLIIDIDNPSVPTYMLPPADDPFAGDRCDTNIAFGGSLVPGQNEISGPNGLFSVNKTELWAADGPSYFNPDQTNKSTDYVRDPCDSSVRVFDLIAQQQIDHINIGGCFRTDEGAFDPNDQIALFANPSEQPLPDNPRAKPLNDTPFITLISTKPVASGNSHPILKQMNFDGTNGSVLADGGIKQAVWSSKTGLFYVAVPGNHSDPTGGYVAVIDPRHKSGAKKDGRDVGQDHGRRTEHLSGHSIRIVANFRLTSCSPSGAILGPKYELFLGCVAGPEQVIDIRDGHVMATLGTGSCDQVSYNSTDHTFYAACTRPGGRLFTVIDMIDAKKLVFDGFVPTYTHFLAIASDPVTNTDWVPIPGVYPIVQPCGHDSSAWCVVTYKSSRSSN